MATRAIKITGSGNSSNLFFVNWSTNTYHYSPETLAIDDGTSVSVYANNPITLNGTQVASSGYYDFTISKDLTINLTNSGISITDGVSSVDLPSGYTRLEYIESTGTQYIDTGFIANQNCHIIVNAEFKIASAAAWLFGARKAASQQAFGFLTYKNYYRIDYGSMTYNFSTNISYTGMFNIDINSTTVKMGGVDYGTNTILSVQTFTCPCSMYLFANNNNGTVAGFSSAKIFSCQMYDRLGVIVRDFIPAKNSSGVAGLWDNVNGVFYTNSGSGTFKVGLLEMKHCTNIDGTKRTIISGKNLVNGVAYNIVKGRTLISGTGYDIPFDVAEMCTITITGTAYHNGSKYQNYVTVNGVQYTSATTLEVPYGTQIHLQGDEAVWIDGVRKVYGGWEHTIDSNTLIQFNQYGSGTTVVTTNYDG